mgnify:CR=1 FL=1
MEMGLIMYVAWMVFMAITVIALVAWFIQEGQHKDIEEPKYKMLEDHEPQPWPGRSGYSVLDILPPKLEKEDRRKK